MVASTHPGAMAQGHEGAGKSLNCIMLSGVMVIMEGNSKWSPYIIRWKQLDSWTYYFHNLSCLLTNLRMHNTGHTHTQSYSTVVWICTSCVGIVCTLLHSHSPITFSLLLYFQCNHTDKSRWLILKSTASLLVCKMGLSIH